MSRGPAWVGQVDRDDFSWTEAVGGWRGAAESVAPGVVFVVLFVLTRSLVPALVGAAVPAGAALLVRLVQGQPLTQALSGVLGVAIGVVWAAASGRGENYFAWGLVSAGALALVLLVSLLVRRPVVTEGCALVWDLPSGWRTRARFAPLRRRGWALTLVWVALFLLRLGVQWPLWRAGMVAELGVTKLVMGLPLFALACWVTWVALRPLAVLRDPDPGAGGDEGVEGTTGSVSPPPGA